jgi:hypothetical protein
MLEQWWGLAILVSQKLARALPKPTWHMVLGGTLKKLLEHLHPIYGNFATRQSISVGFDV